MIPANVALATVTDGQFNDWTEYVDAPLFHHMCGRVGLGKEMRYAIDTRYDLAIKRLVFEARYNLPPTRPIPLLYQPAGEPDAIMANWGLVPFWSKSGKGFFNAQGETAHEKPAFRSAFKKRRGVVLVDWFYEWQKLAGGGKQPYLIRRADGAPLLFAALWEGGVGDSTTPTATILTIVPNEFMAPIHNRMPVILEPEEIDRWIESDPDDARILIQPAADSILEMVPVSELVNSVRNDDPRCAEPLSAFPMPTAVLAVRT
ncbi:MAG: SOS response-associated peptidase [Gemmatimonas sp.]